MPKTFPERITLGVYFTFTVTLFATLPVAAAYPSTAVSSDVVPLLIFALLIFTAQLFVDSVAVFIGMLPFQVASLVIGASLVEVLAPVLSLTLVVTLLLNTGIRLAPACSLPINIAIIAVHAILRQRSSLQWHDHLEFVLIEMVAVAGCLLLIVYREALVVSRRELESARDTLQNVSAANESFVEHLPEMRRQSAEEERLRVTRELHDSLGYSMTNILSMMNAVQYLIDKDPRKVSEYCTRTKELASTTMEETRSTLYRLRAAIDKAPHNARIFFHMLCNDFQSATSVTTECHLGNLPESLPGRVFHLLLRSVQVALINAVRHGKTTQIRLFFWVDSVELRTTVWNSTDRWPQMAEPTHEGIGIKGIRERLCEFGGLLDAGYSVDGYVFCVRIPKKEIGYGA